MSDNPNTESSENLNEPLEKPIKEKKPRKPKTHAQLEQFETVRLKLAEKRQQTKLDKEIKASQLLLSHGIELPAKRGDISPLTPFQKERVRDGDISPLTPFQKEGLKGNVVSFRENVVLSNDDDNDDDDDEPQVIIVKKKKKKKQPKTIIVEESSSESDDDEQQYINKVKEARHFISQQNKKSLIKVHKKNDVPNYFVD